MSDIDLTPEQWRMARQAGAAFTDESQAVVTSPYGAQLSLLDDDPAPGSTWRNIHTGAICTVIDIEQRAYAWVNFRRDGRQSTGTLTAFLKHHRPCRADGRPL